MTITRRNVLLGATAAATLAPFAARAQTSEVVIGLLYPFSGAAAQQGVDSQKAYEAALDVINNVHDFDLPLAKGAGLPGLALARRRGPGSSGATVQVMLVPESGRPVGDAVGRRPLR